ncbi:citrate/2-methylcitrate synthase [Noviherbaspirillum sp.]|jgi:citrate synthase|uniref:citrate/2-methylcitrate synthase n=1 Tax=Noviherbaspirillum sp. TaxID=1926288 RepID=UPI0025E3B8CB|nr:citrate/2-methylcitrate synthase [Noviherbaspirillum sp.]
MSGDFEPVDAIHTRIWNEEPEADNPFSARSASCHGYDVFGEMLGNARWVEMLFLLFRGEAPTEWQADLLEAVAVALANPGPRDPSVHAAMCAGVCGSTAASSLIAALAAGAGGISGGREVQLVLREWRENGMDLSAWERRLASKEARGLDIWPDLEHPPGFEPYGVSRATTVKQAMACFARISSGPHLRWLSMNVDALERVAERPLALSGVAAAAFHDLGFSADEGELLHLILRLPGAAAHALEQKGYGFRKFPFFSVDVENDPEKERQ